MFLDKLLLKDFGKFHNKELTLSPGLNVVTGEKDSGKSTVADFICASVYGISASEEAGDKPDELEKRKPVSGVGFSGKAAVKHNGEKYLLERSFLKKNRTLSALDLASGREKKLEYPDTLYGTLTDLTKNMYRDALMIPASQEDISAAGLEEYVVDLAMTGSTRFHRKRALAYLNEKKSQQDEASWEKLIEDIEQELTAFDTVDDELFSVREQIDTVEQEFAMETAKRKREARKLISTSGGGVKYEENKELNEDLDALSEGRVFLNADILKDYKPPKELKDRLWFIMLVAAFVIIAIAAMVWALPFSDLVRWIFVGAAVLLCMVTILQGLYDKGELFADGYMPTEAEFKQIIYDLERKNEVYEDVEIDMSFAKEFMQEKERLHGIEKGLLEQCEERDALKEKLRMAKEDRARIETERTSINLAINTINELCRARVKENHYFINGGISDIISTITGGDFTDAQIGRNQRLVVRDRSGEVRYVEELSKPDLYKVYVAVRIAVARRVIKDRLPLMVDELPFTDRDTVLRTVQALSTVASDQIIIFTSHPEVSAVLASENIGFFETGL